MAVLPELHVPPGVALLSVVVAASQTVAVPVMPDGNGCTVTIAVAMQPVAAVKVMAAVPTATPVTVPVPLMVATAVLPDAHVPAPGPLARTDVKPLHTESPPEIAVGGVLTVTVAVVKQLVLN